jgi:hypothetical protein
MHPSTPPSNDVLPVAGLFGTCGQSTWRRAFIAAYEARSIRYFNPQVEHWTPEMAAQENEHFRRDAVLLFPVTAESTGFGTLAEIGLSILEIERHNQRHPETPRHMFVFVDPACTDPAASEAQIKDSIRARKLVLGKLPAYAGPFVHVCPSLEDMLQRSLDVAPVSPR